MCVSWGVHNALLRSCIVFGLMFVRIISLLCIEAVQQTANRASRPSMQYAEVFTMRAACAVSHKRQGAACVTGLD